MDRQDDLENKDLEEVTIEEPQTSDSKVENESTLVEDTPEVESEDLQEENTQEPFTPDNKPTKFVQSQEVTKPLDKEVTLNETLNIIREAYSNLNQVLERQTDLLNAINEREEALEDRLRNQGKDVTDGDGNAWYRTLLTSLAHAQINKHGEDALGRDEAEWVQSVDYEGRLIRPGQPKQKLSGKHSVDELVTYISRKASTGIVYEVPLWHSGIWLRLKTPPLSALTDLQYDLNQLKVTLGSESKGMAFSNTAQSLMSVAIDFALQYVIGSSVHYTTPSDLKEKISLLDANIILWALAVTLFPKGHAYAHTCIADPEKCQHVTKEILNLNRLIWTDTLSLTKTQRKLMARRFDKNTTEEELTLYQTEHVRGGRRMVWFDSIGLTLKVPTIQEFEDAGRAWIDGIITMTQGAFNEPPHGSNRNQYITRLGMATTARQYSHWVESIHELDEDDNEVKISDDTEVINETLNYVFSNDEYVEDFFDKINKYMDDALVSIVAVPSFNCQQCNSPASEKFHERFEHLVPIDVLTAFFTLVSLKHK